MSYDFDNTAVRIIDKTNITPTGITEGGLIDGDLLTPLHVGRIVTEEGDGKTPNLTLLLFIPLDGKFVRSAPILMDKDAPDKYLIEIKLSQNGNSGRLQRYRLSSPSLVDDPDLGEVLSVPCESIAYEPLKESLVSINDELVSPKQRIINILLAWNNSPGNNAVFLTFDSNEIDIPNTSALAFDYTPTTPKSVDKLIQDVITRIKEAGPLGGVFKNFYYTTEADPISTLAVKFKMEEFGNTDSGVTIDPNNPQAGTLEDRLVITSNKRRKKIIVVKYNTKAGSLPTEHQEVRSKFNHAIIRAEWDVLKDYLEGDLVKWTDTSLNPNVIRYFTANVDVSSGGANPSSDSSSWFEDFTIIPPWNADTFYEGGVKGEVISLESGSEINFFKAVNDNGPSTTLPNLSSDWDQVMLTRPIGSYNKFISPSPWTSNLANFKTNLDGRDAMAPFGYAGVCVDWNYARILNDIPDYTNRFQTVTGKDVRDILNAPPLITDRHSYNGVRYLVGTSPTGDFTGHENQVAQFVSDDGQLFLTPEWKFSLDPVDGDVIYNHKDGNVYSYNGNMWNVLYSIPADHNKPGPVHAVKSIRNVKDASGIPGDAIELRYDWKHQLDFGDDINRSSRGVWIAFFYPVPIEDADTNLGGLYGGNGNDPPLNAYINHINLNFDKVGSIGWNNKYSESQGRISEHAFKVRVGFWRSTDGTILSRNKSNIKMVYWRKDENNRFFFKDFTIPENNGWHTLIVSLPPYGPSTDLYFSRIDEMWTISGLTLPFDFFIKEKEFEGVKYEFRRNQSWGVFMKDGAYNDKGLYINNYDEVLESFAEVGTQYWGDFLESLENAKKMLTGEQVDETAFTIEGAIIDHANVALCELHYNKEGYAKFPDETADDPRYQLVRLENETDYLTAKAKAESVFVTNDFFPNERHVACFGDVRIRYGQLITETGVRVPGGTISSVVANIKETIDNKGYKQELFTIRKFTIT